MVSKVNFRSDNEAPVADEILTALVEANKGTAHAYGEDRITAGLERLFSEVFETSLSVFPVATGTGANALSIAQTCPPYGAAYCYAHAHLYTDECGAPEFFSGGAKLLPLEGSAGKIPRDVLSGALAATGDLGDHESRPSVLSVSQSTEVGTVYSLPEIADLSGVAHEHGLHVHMDGARLANAIHRLGCSPAEATWRAGVDILSFGATKNGAMLADAVVVFRKELANALGRRRKRGGQLLSKHRYVSAQLNAYVTGGLWLKLAGRANRAADRLSRGIACLPGVALEYPTEANEVFVRMPVEAAAAMHEAGCEFHRWPGSGNLYRLVTSFATTDVEVETFIATLQRALS